METLRLGLKPVLWNRGRRCPLLYLRQGTAEFSSLAPSCSPSLPTGEESGDDQIGAGLSSSLLFAVAPIVVTRAGSLCPSANALHVAVEEGEAQRREQEGN